MNIRSTSLLALGAALWLAPVSSLFAQSTWETVDSLTPWRGRDIVADADGNFISITIDNGATGSTGVVSTLVNLSADHGATWQTVGSIAGYAVDLTVAPDGALFASGNRSATVSGRAFVWQSLDHGATWTVSDPNVGLATVLLVTDVAAGNTDSLYVGGTSGGRWMVRKGLRSANGLIWSTVDNPAGGGPASIAVRPGLAGQPDEIVASRAPWFVRRSIDSGATWTTLNNPGGPYVSQNANGIAFGANGVLLVSGTASQTTTTQTKVGKKIVTTTTTVSGGIIRRSSDGGATWTDLDFLPNFSPTSIAVDAFGRIFTAGSQSGTASTWLVRGSIDGGATWWTTDTFLPAGTTRSMAYGVAGDAVGNVCVIGEAGSTAATYTAPVRRLAVP